MSVNDEKAIPGFHGSGTEQNRGVKGGGQFEQIRSRLGNQTQANCIRTSSEYLADVQLSSYLDSGRDTNSATVPHCPLKIWSLSALR